VLSSGTCDTMWFGTLVLTFHRNLLPTHSALKMEAKGSFKTLVLIYWTTWHHTP